VDAFLNNGIKFHQIPSVIESVMDAHQPEKAKSLGTILKADAWAREQARLIISD
jgi:1-deoxy-D-xylulose 5-phosphate reductoisomerase